MSKTDYDTASGSEPSDGVVRTSSLPQKLIKYSRKVIKRSKTSGDLTDRTLFESNEFSFGSDTQLSPTQAEKDFQPGSPKSNRSRNQQFHRLFPDIKDSVINSYYCALVDDLLFQGVLYISQNWFCFHSKVLVKKSIKIRVSDVTNIVKMNTALIIPNAVGIYTKTEKYVFGSLMTRKNTYQNLLKIWQETGASSIARGPGNVRITENDVVNNNNPSKMYRDSRQLSTTTDQSQTTSASDDVSESPDQLESEKRGRKQRRPDSCRQGTDDEENLSQDVFDVTDSATQPDASQYDAHNGGRTSILKNGVVSEASNERPSSTVVMRKRTGAKADGLRSREDSSAVGNVTFKEASDDMTPEVRGTNRRLLLTSRILTLITIVIIVLLLSAIFMALKLAGIQAKQEVSLSPADDSPPTISGAELYRQRHERHRAIIERLHTMTEAHVNLLDKVKKSLEELASMADKTEYRSLSDELDSSDGGSGVPVIRRDNL